MNKLIVFFIIFLPVFIFAQHSNVGINTTAPDSSAVLDINSTDGGLLIPRMTLFQRDVISNPATGLLVFQTDYDSGFYYFDGVNWKPFYARAINGLNLDTTINRIQLGGPLIKNTTVTQDIYNMAFDLDSTGVFEITDNNSPFFYAGNNGRIGIGTNTPDGKLTIHVDTLSRGLQVYNPTGNTHIPWTNGWSYLGGEGVIFRTTAANTEQVRITPNGFTGFGLTTPTQRIHSAGNLQVDGRTVYFGPDQSIYGDNSSAFYLYGNHSTISQLIMTDKEEQIYGRIYGSGDGVRFGLLDGDSQWALRLEKDVYTSFSINNSEKMRILANGRVGVGTTVPAQSVHTIGNLRADGRSLFLGQDMRLYGDNSSAFYFDGNHSTIAQLIIRDAENVQYGRLYGNGDGANFGLQDADANWSILVAKDLYTRFLIDNVEKYRLTPTSLEFRNSNNNIAIGQGTNTDSPGEFNIGIGINAFNDNTNGENNIGIGKQALFNNANGDHNIGIGDQALFNGSIGNDNIGIGRQALFNISNGDRNIGIGFNSLGASVNGFQNVSIGFRTGEFLSASTNNSFFGSLSGRQLIGSTNTCIGYNSGVGGSVPTLYTNSTAIGANARITANNQVRIGSNLTTTIGGFQPWTNHSDGNFKTNVKEDVPGLDFVMKLRPVTYKFDIDKLKEAAGLDEDLEGNASLQKAEIQVKNQLETGFVAQEVETAARALGYDFSGVDVPKNENDHYGLRYSTFVVPLVKAVQEQQETIKQQDAKIEALETANDEILKELKEIKKMLAGEK